MGYGSEHAGGAVRWPEWSPAMAAAVRALAGRYVWWKSPDEALELPERVIAQVMNMGDHQDVEALAAVVGDGILRDVLRRAEAGQFSERAWTYWHYRLEDVALGQVPPLPRRTLGP